MPDFDTRVPHNARVYDYLLGGKDNYAADREAGDRFLAASDVVHSVRANRAFLARAVRFLAADTGVRQFLVAPGVVRVAEWRPVSGLEAARPAAVWASVARKP